MRGVSPATSKGGAAWQLITYWWVLPCTGAATPKQSSGPPPITQKLVGRCILPTDESDTASPNNHQELLASVRHAGGKPGGCLERPPVERNDLLAAGTALMLSVSQALSCVLSLRLQQEEQLAAHAQTPPLRPPAVRLPAERPGPPRACPGPARAPRAPPQVGVVAVARRAPLFQGSCPEPQAASQQRLSPPWRLRLPPRRPRTPWPRRWRR